ncbi:hypothetical protein XPA_009344 [Xanthoria parietina]
MAFAQPAVKDNFLYNGDLFVDVGNLNRHKRASVAEITEVLRPDLKNVKNAAAVKDPVGHWYEAQLIHYGLPPSKDKARAKMRLLENLNQSKLTVPPRIAAIEAELKKEFAAAERKAKVQYKAGLAATQSMPEEGPPSKKRKDAASQSPFPTVNVNITMGEATSANQDFSPPKKRKLQTARRGGSTSVPPAELSHAAFQQNSPAAEVSKPRPKQTARRSASSSLSYRSNPTSSHLEANATSGPITATQTDVEPKKAPKPVIKKEAKVKQEPAVKKEPTVKKESKVKAEPSSKKKTTSSSSAAVSLGLINGIYEIDCPEIEREWDYDGFTMILTLDTPSIWGEYDFGMFSGILHIPRRPFAASNEAISFQWRGRENSESQMSFGDSCVGSISFLGNGYIDGWINLYGECRFQGRRRDGPGTAIRSATSMRDEWDGYNEDEYERERVGRWH